MDVSLVELISGLGTGGVIAVIIFHFYRKDRKTNSKKWEEQQEQTRQDRVFMENRLTKIIESDQEGREENTQALTELVTLLKVVNGRLGR